VAKAACRNARELYAVDAPALATTRRCNGKNGRNAVSVEFRRVRSNDPSEIRMNFEQARFNMVEQQIRT
jgi:hypothetical protein